MEHNVTYAWWGWNMKTCRWSDASDQGCRRASVVAELMTRYDDGRPAPFKQVRRWFWNAFTSMKASPLWGLVRVFVSNQTTDFGTIKRDSSMGVFFGNIFFMVWSWNKFVHAYIRFGLGDSMRNFLFKKKNECLFCTQRREEKKDHS